MPSAIPDYQRTEKCAVAIFGWSRTEVGTPRWQQAESVGRLAAQNGLTVITGGYGGSMEATSKGAREVKDVAAVGSPAASVEVVGIVVSELFPDRQIEGNRYLTKLLDSTSLLHRIEQLTTSSRYFIILPGTIGTLQEMVTIWVQKIVHPRELPMPVIVAFRDPWEKCCQGITESLQLSSQHANAIHFVDTPEEAIEWIVKDSTGDIDGSQA
ncbi:hypothetical protein LSCM1_00950 [Leishmania martiniquensis]|uniref:Ribosomal protein L32-like protein n=1 Tax=Leishmania martiniquensis TaxID=1580590 RepID=A0A836GMW2_9TRYP|nr:hypothetical protein LSCM1_00950 [Leishmania martiniquensis]